MDDDTLRENLESELRELLRSQTFSRLHIQLGDVYLRRVRDPNPMLEALARQVVDDLERYGVPSRSPVTNFETLAHYARLAGVPIDYVLDERERRARQ